MAYQQEQIAQEAPEQQWQPTYTVEQTRNLIKNYQSSPQRFKEEDLELIRKHAQFHNVPFYEGDFSILEAIKQAGGGILEGFTTLRVADPPDNEYEAIARNLGHLVGFVPGILSGPLKALGLLRAAKAVSGVKSIPMLAADYITKGARKVIKPAMKGALKSRFNAVDTASKFFLKDKAKHMVEGAFHLGTASAISSVWDGIDQMWASFKGGAIAGGAFRAIGNAIPGTKSGDKVIRGIAGSMFLGLPSTARGATTPEQIYEYLIGAYFGAKEMPWYKARAFKGKGDFDRQMDKNPKLSAERNPEEMEGWEKYPEIVQKHIKQLVKEDYGTVKDNQRMSYALMKLHGITDKIPAEDLTTKGYEALHAVRKGQQKKTRYKAHDKLGVGASGGAPGADATWGKVLDKYGFPVLHFIPEALGNDAPMKRYLDLRNKGQIKGIEVGLKDEQLMEAGPAVEQANATLKRPIEKMSRQGYEYILRNWFQVRNASSLYAIGNIESGYTGPKAKLNMKTVKGGTGWAVQMALDKGMQNVFVFDQRQGSWFQWSTDANRFKAIHGTPKLKSNPALIGSRKITTLGKEAIKDVAEITFGKLETGKKSTLPEAVDQKDIKQYHVKTIQTINNLKTEIDAKKQDIRDINKVFKTGKPDKVRMKELNKQKKQLQKEIDLIYKEIVDVHQPLEPTEYVDIHTGETVSDVDTGMKAQEFSLMKKSEYFSNRFLKDLWDAKEGVLGKRDSMLDYGKQAEIILRNYIEPGNKDIKINEVVKDMEQAFGKDGKDYKISLNAKNHIKKWLRELNLGKQVIYVKSRGGKIIQFTNPQRPTSASGMAIRQVESPKLIEEVYEAEGGELKTGVGSPLVVFDSISRTKKNGIAIDVPLDKLIMHFRFTEGMKESEAIEKADNLKGYIIRDLLKKHNLYPLGGQGDKGRIIFSKLHPKNRGKVEYKKKYLELIRALKKIDKKALTLLKNDSIEMKRRFGVSLDDFKKMVTSNLMYDLSLNGYKDTPTNIAKLMGDGFIPSAIGFNKRNQIWMTLGYPGNKEFFKTKTDDLGNVVLNDLSSRGNLLYRLIQDPKLPDKLKNKILKALTTQLPEHVDGALLVRDDVLELINEDAGNPELQTQNKSFIVDNTPKVIQEADYKLVKGSDGRGKIKQVQPYIEKNMGALLGKYMMHGVGEAASAEMKKEGIHMMIMTSAAKQIGERIPGRYDVRGGLKFTGGEIYELDPGSIKYNTSVINDKHMLGNQIWVKQLFTNLHQFGHSPITKETIEDINQEIIQKTFNGDPKLNKELDNYVKTLDESKMDNLLQNLENIGTRELIAALKTSGAERFAERAMQQMLRIVEKDIEAQFQEGEITSEERAATLQNLAEAISPVDRLLKNVALVGEEAAAAGQSGYSGYLHKYVRDYRAAVLHNYFVKSVTRPRTDNSAVARIRPYDRWMQQDKNMKELNDNDKIFFLDDAYKQSLIKLPDGRKIELGELWDLKNNSAYKNIAKQVFNALVLRVPMDSLSGAHKLEFKGFTGRKGHGILMHSRSMRALGGADLDADEAFIYFGGKNEDGSGYGMKQSWLDAIDGNKSEFYNKSKTDVTDNKKAFRSLLTQIADEDHPLKKSKALYYSPLSRIAASEGAYQGRNMLGIAVVQSQVLKSAYSSVMDAEGKSDVFTTRIPRDGLYRVTLTPKTTKAEQKYQRELTRAQIAFASDPLDEAGLKDSEVFFNTMHDAYFKASFEKYNKKTKKFVKTNKPSKLKPTHLKQGLVGHFYNMNKGYFSRNYEEGRRYSMDEVNHLASNIRHLDENQKNTMLPKIVETLEGLDWSDNLFNRVDRNAIERTYQEIEEMVTGKDTKFGDWLKKAMNRSSFRVVYNDHIESVVINKLYDRTVRHAIANNETIEGLREFQRIVKHSMFGKEFNVKAKRLAKLYNYDERLQILEQMHRQSEDFLSNDIATMSTLLNIKRILENNRINPKTIAEIHKKTEQFKTRSYLARKERRQLDYDAYLGTVDEIESIKLVNQLMDIQDIQAGVATKAKDLAGDTRSVAWDQMELDVKIREFKDGLRNDAERELFDHLMIGTLNRGDISKIKKYIDMLPAKKHSPILRDLISKLVKDAARTTQSRLAINSEQISDIAIQNHFKAMNNVHTKMWKEPSEEKTKSIFDNAKGVVEEVKPSEPDIVDELVQGAFKGEGYAGIKKGELTDYDKKLITDIAVILKRYNKKLGNNIPDLNEQIRGLTGKIDPDFRGKNLNALHRQDFENIRRYLQEAENGTLAQRIWLSDNPELQKRYWSLFPETTNRELMAYDIKWLKVKGYYVDKSGEINEGFMRRPTYFLEMFQDIVSKNNGLATGKAETIAKEIENDFVNLTELKEGNSLFKIAVAQKELGVKKDIDRLEEPDSIKEYFRLVYDTLRNNTEAEFDWPMLKNKKFTVLNDTNERISATGFDIVNGNKAKSLTGIKTKISNKFAQMHKLIVGDKAAFNKYRTGKHFDPDTKLQPKMNWKKFITDMNKALQKGDDIPMELGIDGMRHIMRSMMYDLATDSTQRGKYASWIIKPTGKVPFERYWPHMFFDRKMAETSIRRAVEFIRKDSSLNEEQRQKAIEKIAIRHKTVTGDWEFQDMQDWDKVDVLEMQEGFKRIAEKKSKEEQLVKWTDMNPTFSSMHTRKGHIPGWSTDMNVMQVYGKNLVNTYYRQISHLMSRNVLNEAKHRMTKKFGPRLAYNWQRFFKLYIQGAMGQPDVIPERWYEDPEMKLKGTPFAWWADNRVLERVNKIRKALGLRESDLPKELKDFDYNDLRHWSNMEAKFELASLLAHPKTAITNIFGGSLHTIASVGPGALIKARSIKFLKRIFPKWTSLQDADDFVTRKGVVPEFMIHELGLGKDAKGVASISKFIGDLSSKINSKDPIDRKEIFSLGKKHGIGDAIVSKAAKFMSIPERMLRRDAFMAHYIRAWERFGGAIKDPEHPFLIEIAKKGVKATQFLYEAPFRPFFARTALGKIMTRFQLYAWNSWRFRNDVIRQAKHYGFKKNTEAYDRFVRTAQIDLFVLALGNMFVYSLFDNALPQPWGWFQDTSEWIFGDEKERNRAFFGSYPTAIAPLQIITPPLARFPVSSLMQWARDDYTRFTDYQIYTALPFGRIVRDIFQPDKGLIDNPSRILEKFAGMPLRDIQRFTAERRKKIEEGKRYKAPTPGVF